MTTEFPFNEKNHMKGGFPEWPLDELKLEELDDDNEIVIYPSSFKFQFCLKSFYMDNPFTRAELNDLNKIYEKYGINEPTNQPMR